MAASIAALAAGLQQLPLHVLLPVVVSVVLLTAIALRVLSNTFHGSAPPVDEGVPFIGGLIKFSKGPWELMQEIYRKHGEVVTVPLLHKRMTFLFGPHASPHFFNATDDKMSQTEVYNFNVPTFGPGVVYDVDLKIRSEQFRIVTNALGAAKLKSYIPHFRDEAESYFAKWGQTGVVNLPDVFGEVIILTASRTLLGREVRESMFTEVSRLYHDLDDGMRPLSVLFPYLPTAYHRRRDAARARLAQIFGDVIKARRASGAQEGDMLQVLIDASYKSVYGGRSLNDGEITGLLIAMLFAGQHTSTITASWTGLHMMANPASLAEAEAEQRAVLAACGDALDMETLNSMDVLHRNIQEALRLGPPLIMLMRMAKESFEVTTSAGERFVIPKGHIVAASPTFNHRLAHVYKDPEVYQPDRYLAPRNEGKGLDYLGFGGGRHGCIGQNFAYLQIKTIWSVLLRKFEFEMLDPFPEPDFTSMVIGPKPCRVRYTRRAL